jgi:hypothetical protein
LSFSPVSNEELVKAQGLTHLIDALVALAEWRLQNLGGGSALQKDPSAFLTIRKLTDEFLKVTRTLVQLCPGGSEMPHHLKQGLIYSHPQHSQQQSKENIADFSGTKKCTTTPD